MATTTAPAKVKERDVDGPRALHIVVARSRARLVAACYVGMTGLALLAVVLGRLLPKAVGVPIFVLVAVVVLAVAHPAIKFTRRT